MKWQSDSEVVTGLVLSGRLASSAVRPEILMPPYNDIVKAYKNGSTAVEDLVVKFDFAPIQTAMEAEKSVNGLGDYNWAEILEGSYLKYSVGRTMEKLGRNLQQEDDVDAGKVRHMLNQFEDGRTGRVPLSEIVETEVPFHPIGWKPWDDHLGGLPEVGLITIAGNPGVGKTSLLARISGNYVKQYLNKTVGFYSLEMILPEIGGRFREIQKLDKETEKRIEINCDPLTADQVIADAAKIDNLGLIIVDFADYMIRGETNESAMGNIYRTMAIGSKQLNCPTILLSQLNRGYGGGIPRPKHIRYTGLAEALSSVIAMPYNPTIDFYEERDAEVLPIMDDIAYLCMWKFRGGFRLHKEDSPGAIAVPFKGEFGWHNNKSKWFSLKKEV